MSFQIHALSPALFAAAFTLPDTELTKIQARRVVVDASPGYPCRVSLADAEIGETVLLVHYCHQPHPSPYQASHAIFVRDGVSEFIPAAGTVPDALRRRLLSVRAFDGGHDMVDADVVEGALVEPVIERLFSDPSVAYIHLHNAKPGCYAARVTRV